MVEAASVINVASVVPVKPVSTASSLVTAAQSSTAVTTEEMAVEVEQEDGQEQGKEEDTPQTNAEANSTIRISDTLKNTTVVRKHQAECPICMKIMLKKNLRRHVSKIHKEQDPGQLPSVMVDPQSGLHMVAKSMLGPLTPTHVVVKTTGPVQSVLCDERACMEAKDASKRGRYGSFMCKHVNAVSACHEQCHYTDLTDDSLKAALDNKSISEKSCTSLKEMRNKAKAKKVMLVAAWRPTGYASIYFSVYSGDASPMTSGREVVAFNRATAKMHCSCNVKFHKCRHQHIALWYLFETEPGLLKKDDKDSSDDHDENVDAEPQIAPANSLKNRLDYYKSKAYPSDLEAPQGKRIHSIEPLESVCPQCKSTSSKQLATEKGKIFGMKWVQNGKYCCISVSCIFNTCHLM